MRLTTFIFFALLGLVAATPLTSKRADPFEFEQLSFTFAGGPASYTLNFPADGQTYYTSTLPLPFFLSFPLPLPLLFRG